VKKKKKKDKKVKVEEAEPEVRDLCVSFFEPGMW